MEHNLVMPKLALLKRYYTTYRVGLKDEGGELGDLVLAGFWVDSWIALVSLSFSNTISSHASCLFAVCECGASPM